MTDRPMPFTAEMVRAILDGSKCQTRRVIKPKWVDGANPSFTGWRAGRGGGRRWRLIGGMDIGAEITAPCAPGDRLWVREAFWIRHDTDSDGYQTFDCGPSLEYPGGEVDYCATPECETPPSERGGRHSPHSAALMPGDWWFAPPAPGWDGTDEDYAARGEWIFLPWALFTKYPGMFMPRWASRITLLVEDVTVQRLLDIDGADARAEGFDDRAAFLAWWEDRYRKKPERQTAANPWVARITFRRDV